MKRNILIISSDFTGHGHKSITESLLEQLAAHPEANVHIVDGFTLGGTVGLRIGKMYGSVTRNAKELWRLVWDISLRKPSIINDFTEIAIKDNFIKLLKNIKPDTILSVHPNFNGSVLNILEELNVKIPLIVFIADLVSISPLWADPRADHILCPTHESKYKCIEFGVPESKLTVTGFPVRSRFTRHIGTSDEADSRYSLEKPLECLIMSGGEGVGNMSSIARILLSNFNCRVKIVAGRNQLLKKRLERTFEEEYPGRVEVYGFMQNIQDLMLSSDIAFTRGSPNVMMEAVSCNVPLVITGALPGQEEGNPGYLQKYNLGIVCNDSNKLKHQVAELLDNNAQKLNRIKSAQRDFRKPEAAKTIIDFLLNMEAAGEVVIPDSQSMFRNLSVMSSNGISRTKTMIIKKRKSLNESLSKIKLSRKRI